MSITGKDCKGRLIRIGDQIIMPDPNSSDLWAQGNFIATVKTTKTNLITVEDAEGDCFDIKPERVTLNDDRYPIYCPEDIKNLSEGLYLALFHGYKDEKEREEIDDWGSNGPVIGPVKYVQTTYACHIKFEFMNADDAKKYGLPVNSLDDLGINSEGCVEFDGLQYGDYTVFYHKEEKA